MFTTDNQTHARIKEIMIDLMAVLYENGIKEAQVGILMRLLGVDEENASIHDNESIVLDENFGKMLVHLNKRVPHTIPFGTTLH